MNNRSVFAMPLGAPLWVIFITAIVIIGNLVSLVAIDVHPDEAYYWAWAIYPDWSYYDHPPMIGWMLWVVDRIFGINDLSLRLPAILAWTVAAWSVFRIAESLFEARTAGWIAVAIFSMLPVFQAASHIITPDSPLLLFVSLTYFFLLPAVSGSSNRSWVAVGLAAGGAFLSKYNAVLIPLGVFLGMIAVSRGRRLLATWYPWIGLGISAVLFLPVVYWNYLNDWISFSYQLGHGVRSEFRLDYLGIYIGGQMGAALIWVFVAMAFATIKVVGQENTNRVYISILVAGFWLPLVFFGYAGSTTIGEVNWPAMAYLPGTVLLAGVISRLAGYAGDVMGQEARKLSFRRKLIAVVMVASTLFSVLIVNIFRFPVEAKQAGLGFMPTNTQLSDTFGWKSLHDQIVGFRQDHGLPADCRVSVSTKYIWASMAYRFRDVDQFAILPGSGTSQYEFWQSRRVLSDRKPCLIIVRLPHDANDYPRTERWNELGQWRLVDTYVTPTSDTPRVYGFYLPDL